MDGFQERLIWEVEVEVAARPVGTLGGVLSTVTVVVAVVVPVLLTAVKVNNVVVDRAGVVVDVPVTVPMVGLIDKLVAPEAVQDRVDVLFKATTLGEARKEEMEGAEPQDTETFVMLEEATVPEPLLTEQVWPEG